MQEKTSKAIQNQIPGGTQEGSDGDLATESQLGVPSIIHKESISQRTGLNSEQLGGVPDDIKKQMDVEAKE